MTTTEVYVPSDTSPTKTDPARVDRGEYAAHPYTSVGSKGRGKGRVLIVVAIVAIAVNLRPAVTSLGAMLHGVRADLGMSGFVAGLLTALPVLCFAGFGAPAPALGRRLGEHRLVLGGLLAIAAGLAIRTGAATGAVFIAASVISMAGIAVANVLLPVLIKRHFPDRVGFMTGVYSTSMAVGTALPAAVTVPIAHTIGYSWRGGLGVWALAAGIAAVPWVVVVRRRGRGSVGPGHRTRAAGAPAGPHRIEPLRLSRSVTAWGLVFFFGMQSLAAYSVIGWLPQIYREAGASARTAGYLLAFATMLAIPIALVLPTVAARRGSQRPYVLGLVSCAIAGYLGLAIAPAAHPWLWALLLGLANCAFPLALTMIGLRGRTGASVARLSGFAQSVGYLLAAAGPLGVGALHEVTGGWDVPLGLLIGFACVQLVAGMIAGRDRHVDDEVAVRPAEEPTAEPAIAS